MKIMTTTQEIFRDFGLSKLTYLSWRPVTEVVRFLTSTHIRVKMVPQVIRLTLRVGELYSSYTWPGRLGLNSSW